MGNIAHCLFYSTKILICRVFTHSRARKPLWFIHGDEACVPYWSGEEGWHIRVDRPWQKIARCCILELWFKNIEAIGTSFLRATIMWSGAQNTEEKCLWGRRLRHAWNRSSLRYAESIRQRSRNWKWCLITCISWSMSTLNSGSIGS